MLAFATVGVQVLSLGLTTRPHMSMAVSEPVATSFSRPDIIDRNGRLLATDVEAPSLFADPAIVIDRDEIVEKLKTVLPDLNQDDLRAVARRQVAPVRVDPPWAVAEGRAAHS